MRPSANVTASNPRFVGLAGWAIVALALAIRLFYVWVAEVNWPLRADSYQYFRIAINVEEYGTFSTAQPTDEGVAPDSYRAPGYPALIAALNWIFGSISGTYWAVLIVQCLLGAGTVLLSLLLALRMMSRSWAYAAAILVAVWPHLVTLSGYVLTETTFGFFVALSAWALARMLERERWTDVVCCSAALAAAALVNQMILGYVVLLVVWYLLRHRTRRAILFAVLALAPPALWAVRDAEVGWTGIRSGAGRLMENVLVGSEPDFIPRYKGNAGEPKAVAARQRIAAEQHVFAVDPPRALNDVWQRLRSEPGRYALWYLSKPFGFWTWSIFQGDGDVYVYPMIKAPFDRNPALRAIASVCHGLNKMIMIAAFLGVLLVFVPRAVSERIRLSTTIVVVLFVYATAVHTVLMPDARYAVPFRPFKLILALLTARFLTDLVQQFRARAAAGNIEPAA